MLIGFEKLLPYINYSLINMIPSTFCIRNGYLIPMRIRVLKKSFSAPDKHVSQATTIFITSCDRFYHTIPVPVEPLRLLLANQQVVVIDQHQWNVISQSSTCRERL